MIRIPRPAGLTNQMKKWNTLEGERTRKREMRRIKEHVINQYIKEGFRLNGETKDIGEIARYLQETEKWVLQRIQRFGDLLEGKDHDGMSKALKAISLQGAMASRSLIMAQALYLTSSQSDAYQKTNPGKVSGYVPFLTSEVNRSLTNLIASDNTLLNLLKIVNPVAQKAQPNVVINNQQANLSNGPSTETLININQAVQLIDKGRESTLLEDPNLQNRLLAQHLTPEVPEVIATNQQGFNAKKEAAGLKQKLRKVPLHESRVEEAGEIINPEIVE